MNILYIKYCLSKEEISLSEGSTMQTKQWRLETQRWRIKSPMFLGGNVKKDTKKVSRKIDSSLEEERKGE